MKLMLIPAVVTFVSAHALAGETPSDSQLSSRIAFSAGMGVEYVSAADIVDYVNGRAAAAGAIQRVPVFKAGVGFFGALAYPISSDVVLKAEYVYFLGSYNPEIPYVPSEFTLTAHMPSIILQYVLWDEQLYNIKVGGGLGYRVVFLSEKYFTVDDVLSGKGLGAVIDLEANTAFGDHLFAYLGGDLRFEFVGKLKTNTQTSQGSQNGVGTLPTGNAFSIGARLGFSYYF